MQKKRQMQTIGLIVFDYVTNNIIELLATLTDKFSYNERKMKHQENQYPQGSGSPPKFDGSFSILMVIFCQIFILFWHKVAHKRSDKQLNTRENVVSFTDANMASHSSGGGTGGSVAPGLLIVHCYTEL